MSHKATNWLADLPPEQLSASEFRVLFHLCDCHNPSGGCFPTQAYLITRADVSNRVVFFPCRLSERDSDARSDSPSASSNSRITSRPLSEISRLPGECELKLLPYMGETVFSAWDPSKRAAVIQYIKKSKYGGPI